MNDQRTMRTAEECIAYFEQQGILEHYVEFADPESVRFDSKLVEHMEVVDGLLRSLRVMSRGGRFSVLMEMAKSGEPQPTDGELAISWAAYQKARSSRWLSISSASGGTWVSLVAQKKAELLRIARTPGTKKPNYNSPLGQSLKEYAYSKTDMYDDEFATEFFSARPEWRAITKRDAVTDIQQTKQEIIRLAKIPNSIRPIPDSKLGKRLAGFLRKSCSLYDQEVYDIVHHYAFRWTKRGIDQKVALNKERLIIYAKGAEAPRPSYASIEGKMFKRYCVKTSSTFDPNLSDRVHMLHPEWLPRRRQKQRG